MSYLLITIIIFLMVYFIVKSKSGKTKSKNQKAASKFQPKIYEKEFPDRSQAIVRHINIIQEGFASGDLDLVNLSYAKLIESIRQQNANSNGGFEQILNEINIEYNEFRKMYGYKYPAQFLAPSKRREVTNANELQLKKSIKLENLIKSLNKEGHPEYPLLRKDYSPTSGIPLKDYSNWIIEQLHNNDHTPIYCFLKEYYKVTEEYLEKELKENLERFLKKDFNHLFNDINHQAILEIKTFFIIRGGIYDFNRVFWIADDKEADQLTKILSIYSLSINKREFTLLIEKLNKFLKEVRKDTDYWDNHPDYQVNELESKYELQTPNNLQSILMNLTPGERLHFFDYATYYKEQKYWNGHSSYNTRKFGIKEDESAKKMLELGLFNQVDDINAVPDITSKGELKEAAQLAGLEIKKSWTLAKIYENLMKTDEGREFLHNFVSDKCALSFKEDYTDDLKLILEYQSKIRRVVNLIAVK